LKRLLAAAAAACVLLTGCTGPTKDAEYKDINELGKAYSQAVGVDCKESRSDITKYGWDQATCGPTGIVMMFTSDAKREEIKKKNPLKPGRQWVQGKNWLIAADQYDAEKAQKALGGELLTS